MDKKGFTLVEILAVIVILGIIGAITVPFIMNIVTKARRDAFVDSSRHLVKAASHYRTNAVMNHTDRTLNINFSTDKCPLEVSGELPNSGNLKMDEKGNVELRVWSDKAGICVGKSKDSSDINIVDANKNNCHL
ncbi:MAG: type II secretion system protein [Bacilli bacterium]|nr:type II secretion system protein [Bacilli bacterium]